jgi:glycosyltransferase involved in cell wall biosynthesis
LARINKVKGLTLLLNAFNGLEKEVDNVRLVIAGPDDGYLGQLKEDIKRLGISDKVLLTGPLYKEAKLEAYVDADAYVLPSSYEVFGLTVIEACACGAPTIVTNRCGVADAIREVGCVVDYDTHQLQSAIHNVVTNAPLREKMRERGPVMVRERYDLEKIIDDLEKLYQTCL